MASRLGVIGCGKMAQAILKGLSRDPGGINTIYIHDTSLERRRLFEREFKGQACPGGELVEASDIVLLAVKPGQVKAVLEETRHAWTSEKLVLSIAAGIKTSAIEQAIGNDVPVIRVMPNTPALVGEGMTALTPGRWAGPDHMSLAQGIFAAVGSCIVVDEKYMDAVTAVSGSGPAYIFLVVEAMINAAVNIGLDSITARQMVLQTVKGSIAMLESGERHPAALREDVCSPGGTTIAGVKRLEEKGLRSAFFDAIEAAWLKSVELGRGD